MKSILIISIFFSFTLISCDWAKDKAKDTLHKGGEIVGKAGSEVVDGVKSGVEESFSNLIEVSPEVERKGIMIGRVKVVGTDSTTDNIVSAYLIFAKNFNGKLTAKAFDKNWLEFGRASVDIVVDSGQTKYLDFVLS